MAVARYLEITVKFIYHTMCITHSHVSFISYGTKTTLLNKLEWFTKNSGRLVLFLIRRVNEIGV